MQKINWTAVGEGGVLALIASVALWQATATENLLVMGGLLLYIYLGIGWCCSR